MNYNDTLKYLESISYSKGIKLGLGRVKKILNDFNNPENHLQIVHIAGTNGKGSTAIYLARIFKSHGYKVGLYTSPHLCNYTERISINEKEISKSDFTKYLSLVIQKNKYSLTEFEILTVAAALYFKDSNVDWAIMETGLGGRLDATNALPKKLSIITNVSFDHMQILGKTLTKIAKEKAGIIKHNIPLITAETKKDILNIFKNTCTNKKVPLTILKKNDFKYIFGSKPPYNYHIRNAGLAINAYKYMIKNKIIPKKKINIKDLKLYLVSGRFEEIKKNNMHIIFDGAHNEDGLRNLKFIIKQAYPNKKIILIMGSLKTKEIKNMINTIVPIVDIFIATKGSYYLFNNPIELIKYLPKKKKYIITNDFKEAYNAAKNIHLKNSIILITGSLYLIGEAKNLISCLRYN